MTCQHLNELEAAIQARGIRETFRGKAWSDNCREWVYFDCYIDLAAVRRRFNVPSCVREHTHLGTHNGAERGFVCGECHDGIMGAYEQRGGIVVFPG